MQNGGQNTGRGGYRPPHHANRYLGTLDRTIMNESTLEKRLLKWRFSFILTWHE